MAYNTIKEESKLLQYSKQSEKDGVIIESKIYKVPVSDLYPEGIRYSLYYVKYGKVIIGYDNHYPKGHHKHLHGIEYPYDFENISRLLEDFKKDRQEYERIENESKRNDN